MAHCYTHIYNRTLFIGVSHVRSVLPFYFVQYYSTQKPGQRAANLLRQHSVGVRRRVKSTRVTSDTGLEGKLTRM